MDKLVLGSIQQNSYPNYLHKELYSHILLDENPYIRYIAARNCKSDIKSNENTLIKEKILSDLDLLVRYAQLESLSALFENWTVMEAEDFYSLPPEARLATVRTIADQGAIFADILSKATLYLEKNKITLEELHAVLNDYLFSGF